MKNAQSQTLVVVVLKKTQKDLLVALTRVLSIRITMMKIIKQFIVNQTKSLLHLFYIAKRRNCFELKRKIKDSKLVNFDFAHNLYSTLFFKQTASFF